MSFRGMERNFIPNKDDDKHGVALLVYLASTAGGNIWYQDVNFGEVVVSAFEWHNIRCETDRSPTTNIIISCRP